MTNTDSFKFRAWDKQLKEFHYWCSHSQLHDNIFWKMSQDEGMPVTQSTGPKDKNGKLIYEGDTIQSIKEYNSYTGLNSEIYGGNKYEVKKNTWRAFLSPKPLFYGVDIEDCVIIGNIYENPELLTQSKQSCKTS